jgi:hypothetical protein
MIWSKNHKERLRKILKFSILLRFYLKARGNQMKIDKFSLFFVFISVFLLIMTSMATAAENDVSLPYHAIANNTMNDNKSAWIKIDPIGTHYIGDVFFITGSTNIPIGNQLWFQLGSSDFHPGYQDKVKGDVNISRGANYTNYWAYYIDTSTFKPDQYVITVISKPNQEFAHASQLFNISAKTQPTVFQTLIIQTTLPVKVPQTTQPVPFPPAIPILVLGVILFGRFLIGRI